MTEPASERATPTQPLQRLGLSIEERVAQVEVLLARLEGKSTTSSAELLERQEHLDGCLDELKVEVRAQGQTLLAQGAQLAEQAHLLRGIDSRVDGVQTGLIEVSSAVHRAAWATPAATTGGVGAIGAGLMALGRIFGWW